ncbi:glycosyltransferase family 2 protein [uncultured Cloacibacillus sp.]|uniref:glycosyltransferase family 2 protein n=1 Tax=uncultured Cloacibacillus sp. TaxID=889794 RepID=UPI003208CABF
MKKDIMTIINHPAISVIVPFYNMEQFLSRCIESILHQTFDDFELILINDGSCDNSVLIGENYTYDKRVRIFHQSNRGVSAARNVGLDNSKGEYVLFVDGDDYLDPNALEILYTNMRCGYDLVCGSYRRVTNTCCLYERKFNLSCVSSGQLAQLCWDMHFDIILGGACGKLYSNKIIKENDIYFPKTISYSEDSIFNIRYYQRINKAMLLDSVVYNYFYNTESLTSVISKKSFFDHLRVSKIREEYFKTSLPDFFELENFSNQYIALLLIPSLRLMARQYNRKNSYKLIQCLLKNKKIKRYIYYSRPTTKLNIYTNILIFILKLGKASLLLYSLALINYIASINIIRNLYSKLAIK